RVRAARADAPAQALHPDSLVRKLAIKPDSPFYGWLEQQLARRFDYACCATQEQFRRETLALTRSGQVKTGGERHEKDDRHRLDDRSRYVLGWSNAAKIAALQAQMGELAARMRQLAGEIEAAQHAQKTWRRQLEAWAALHEFADYGELDWAA